MCAGFSFAWAQAFFLWKVLACARVLLEELAAMPLGMAACRLVLTAISVSPVVSLSWSWPSFADTRTAAEWTKSWCGGRVSATEWGWSPQGSSRHWFCENFMYAVWTPDTTIPFKAEDASFGETILGVVSCQLWRAFTQSYV